MTEQVSYWSTLSSRHPSSRAWQVLEVVNIADVPEPVRRGAEHVLAKHALDWRKIACVALVRDVTRPDEPEYPEWLVAVEAPVLDSGDVLQSTGEWSSNRLRSVSAVDAPGGFRVVLGLSVCESVRLRASA